MKDFALDLKECSKDDIKRVENIASSVMPWWDDDRFKDEAWDYLLVGDHAGSMFYGDVVDSACEIYTMPEDWGKIQEALGVDAPKDGEVYSCNTATGRMMVFRYKDKTRKNNIKGRLELNTYSSLLICNNDFDSDDYVCISNEDKAFSKSTSEETTKLIEAEHANEVHWTGEEMVKIPEYVEVLDSHQATVGQIYLFTEFSSETYCKIQGYTNSWFNLPYADVKVVSKEAFEAQEAKKSKLNRINNQTFDCKISNGTIDAFMRASNSILITTLKNKNKMLVIEIDTTKRSNDELKKVIEHKRIDNKKLTDGVDALVFGFKKENSKLRSRLFKKSQTIKELKDQLNKEPVFGTVEYELKKALAYVVTLEDENKDLINKVAIGTEKNTILATEVIELCKENKELRESKNPELRELVKQEVDKIKYLFEKDTNPMAGMANCISVALNTVTVAKKMRELKEENAKLSADKDNVIADFKSMMHRLDYNIVTVDMISDMLDKYSS